MTINAANLSLSVTPGLDGIRRSNDPDGSTGGGYTPTVIVTTQGELDTELAKTGAQLEGAVIGVQYNATPYTISRTQLRKNFLTGGLVICADGTPAPVFSSISIEQATNLTLYGLTLTSSALSGNLITYYVDAGDITIDNCVLHGTYYDPNGSYADGYGATYAGNVAGIYYQGGGTPATGGVTITNCEIYNVRYGMVMATAGPLTVSNNTIYNCYEDNIKIALVSTGAIPSSTTVNWNVCHSLISLSTDTGNPHPDHIQFVGVGAAGDWTNITANGNRIFGGNSRGGGQGLYFADMAGSYKFSVTAKGNTICSGFARGLSIEEATDCTLIGNTVVARAVGQSAVTGIYVGDMLSGGGHVVKNNVTSSITSGTGATETNNHEYTTQSNAVLSALFDGSTFALADLDTLAEVMTNLNMKTGGALDTPTPNIGAVGSGYVDYDAQTLDAGFE